MGWTWRYESESGESVSADSATAESFPSQSDAETWLGETWQQLLADGVEQVTLLEDARVVYGPMSLQPPA
jgi:hypothetical protein